MLITVTLPRNVILAAILKLDFFIFTEAWESIDLSLEPLVKDSIYLVEYLQMCRIHEAQLLQRNCGSAFGTKCTDKVQGET